jgi:hypothetical protein
MKPPVFHNISDGPLPADAYVATNDRTGINAKILDVRNIKPLEDCID